MLAAAKGGYAGPEELKSRLFRADLYLGLFYEASRKENLARKHITQAAEEFNESDRDFNMGDVARVHAQLFRKK